MGPEPSTEDVSVGGLKIADEPRTATERSRDELGRFAPVEQKPEPVQAQQPAPVAQPQADDKDGQVPSWRLREIREARDAAEQRAQEAERRAYAFEQQMRQFQTANKPKPEPVDFFANPDQALEQRIQPIQDEYAQRESALRLGFSKRFAQIEHGKEAVGEMEKAVQQAINQGHPDMHALSMRMQRSDDPVGEAMQWYKNQKLMSETGGDLVAYKQKLLDEAMKDPAFQAKVLEASRGAAQTAAAQPGARPNIQLPPSLSKVPGSGVSAAADADNDMSDKALFKDAMAFKRRR